MVRPAMHATSGRKSRTCPAADELADMYCEEAMEKWMKVFDASKQDIGALTANFIRSLPEDIAILLELRA